MAETFLRKELKEAFLEQGIEDTHFFNGRLLTAGDMVKLQDASRRRDHQLGLAVGTGVASGMEVRLIADGADGKPPVLAISKGLAFDRLGQALALPQNVEVKLSKEKPEQPPEAGFFNYCPQLQQNGKPLPGKGVYLFTIRPAFDYKGLAPRRGFGQAAKVEGCDRDLSLEGVQFRLVSIDITTLDNLSQKTRENLTQLLNQVEDTKLNDLNRLATQHKLRNWLAHTCFGTEELQSWSRDPFARQADDFFGVAIRSPFHTYGTVDKLYSQGAIDDCDVPLALVCWTATGVKWIDMWSVRRRLVAPVLPAGWPLPLSSRCQAENEAIFLQFQEQVEHLIMSGLGPATLNLLSGKHYFRYLPSAGFIPLSGTLNSSGLNAKRFFKDIKVRDLVSDPVYISGEVVMALLHESLVYPAIDLESQEHVWVYRVRQNQYSVDTGISLVSRPLVIFTNGHIPYRGEARFDLAYWSYSNFA